MYSQETEAQCGIHVRSRQSSRHWIVWVYPNNVMRAKKVNLPPFDWKQTYQHVWIRRQVTFHQFQYKVLQISGFLFLFVCPIILQAPTLCNLLGHIVQFLSYPRILTLRIIVLAPGSQPNINAIARTNLPDAFAVSLLVLFASIHDASAP
jgi:hypothetical protein